MASICSISIFSFHLESRHLNCIAALGDLPNGTEWVAPHMHATRILGTRPATLVPLDIRKISIRVRCSWLPCLTLFDNPKIGGKSKYFTPRSPRNNASNDQIQRFIFLGLRLRAMPFRLPSGNLMIQVSLSRASYRIRRSYDDNYLSTVCFTHHLSLYPSIDKNIKRDLAAR